ncbi:MAG: hypothetical protein MRZ90_08095 [Candidatus Gastranaerophilales bacterium]|nr:hypothetical protein [Candidatus Gastranaerophilales bacterium]
MANFIIVIDKIELKYFEFNDLVTNFWIIQELLKRNHNVYITTIDKLMIKDSKPFALSYKTKIKDTQIRKNDLVYEKEILNIDLNQDIDCIFYRPDPPFDVNYLMATYIFDFVNRNNVKFINDPRAIREFNEKLHVNYFPTCMPINIVTASKNEILKFVEEHKKCIIKPLNNCFGQGVYCLKQNDININSIINNVTNNETTLCMVQKYIESSLLGDKRVLTLGNMVLEYAVNKVPNNNDFKFSTHNDEHIKPVKLTKEEYEIASSVAKELNNKGLVMAGLDMIDGKIIEINITSPCYFIREINNLYNVKLNTIMGDYFESILLDKNVLINN